MIVFGQVDLRDETKNPIAKFSDFYAMIDLFSAVLTTVGALVFMTMLLVGAWHVITAGGDPEKLAKARKTILFAIIGISIVAFAYTIVLIVGLVTGTDPLQGT